MGQKNGSSNNGNNGGKNSSKEEDEDEKDYSDYLAPKSFISPRGSAQDSVSAKR